MRHNQLLCGVAALLALQAVATKSQAGELDAVLQRLDALEKENAALKQRLKRVEGAPATAAPRATEPRGPQASNAPSAGAGLSDPSLVRAQALPGKAPIQFVKVCSLYGEGFFYVPGTDACIKFG